MGRIFEDAIRGRGGGDEICNFGRVGVEDHLFRRKDRGNTLLRTAALFRPRMPFDGRLASGEESSELSGLWGNVGNAGTELNASLSSNNDGERGLSRL